MARPSRGQKFGSDKSIPFSINIDFEGIITSTLQGTITADVVKFLLYQRQQSPMPFNQLQRLKVMSDNLLSIGR